MTNNIIKLYYSSIYLLYLYIYIYYEMQKLYPVEIVKISDLIPREWNVNVLEWVKFNKLVDEIRTKWFREPIQVVSRPDGKYHIIWWHHRTKACQYLWFEEISAVIYPPDERSEDEAEFEAIRLNLIRWHVDPVKFTSFVKSKKDKYSDETIQDMLAIWDDKEWSKYLIQVEQNIPEHLKNKFKEAKKNIKTIDQLADVISKIMSDSWNSIERWYVFFNYDWKTAMMITMDKELKKIIDNMVAMSEKTWDNINSILVWTLKQFASTKPEYINPNIADNESQTE